MTYVCRCCGSPISGVASPIAGLCPACSEETTALAALQHAVDRVHRIITARLANEASS